jgi:Zn-dependent protease
MVRIGTAGYLGRIAKFSPPDAKLPASNARRRPWFNIVLTLLAILSFAMSFGWKGAGFIVGTLVVHEFGHWLAFRITGHPTPRVMLIPFLGGVAMGNHPHRTHFDGAFVALMGPAFSIVALAALFGALWLTVPWPFVEAIDGWAQLLRDFPEPERYGRDIARAIFILSVVNLIQLLPIFPLDGGQVLRAAMQSAGTKTARWTVMVFAAAGVGAALWLGDYVIAAVATLGFAGAWHIDAGPSEVRPMGRPGLAVIGAGYVATALIYLVAIQFSLRAFDISLGF